MVERTCAECEVNYEGNPKSTYCSSACRYRAKDKAKRFPCAGCGDLIHPGPGRVEGDARCRDCRTKVYVDARTHGSYNTYRKGCRCEPCTAAAANKGRNYAAAHKAKHGYHPWEKYRRPDIKRFNLDRAARLAIYERDNWVCQLCAKPVDATLHYSHRMAATLDHIECQSWTLIPDHSPSNLRLAHRGCNARRGNNADA